MVCCQSAFEKKRAVSQPLRWTIGVACLMMMLWPPLATPAAGDVPPYPLFTAAYKASAGGFNIGTVEVSLTRTGADEYLYEQKSVTGGIAALFGSDNATESSRWRFRNDAIEVLEYRSQRKGGDDDDNAHLVFDWETLRVRNIGAGKHWEITVPKNTIDRLVMQLAMLLDLRKGDTVFRYRIPHQDRIKAYDFEVVGEEVIALDSGTYRTIKVQRMNEDRDRSWVWSAPALDYFPVRFLKQKKSGIRIELVLQKLKFAAQTGHSGEKSAR